MKYDVTIKTFPPLYSATVRMVIPSSEDERMLWNILMEETVPLHLLDGDPCYCCAVFHDKEYREAEVDVVVQKDVKGCYKDTEHVRFWTLPELPWLVLFARAPMNRWKALTLRLRHGSLTTAMFLTAPCSIFTTSVPMKPQTPMNTSRRSAILSEKRNISGHAAKCGVSSSLFGLKCRFSIKLAQSSEISAYSVRN